MNDFRHTAASYLLMAGVDLHIMADILGHSTNTDGPALYYLLDDHKLKAMARTAADRDGQFFIGIPGRSLQIRCFFLA